MNSSSAKQEHTIAGKGRTVFLPQASGERCPVQSLKAWLAVSGVETGWLFGR